MARNFWFPERDPNKLGIVELWASALVQCAGVRDKADPAAGTLVPAWAANGNRILEVLALPVRFGDSGAAVQALASGTLRRASTPDGILSIVSFDTRAPDVYQVQATVHAADGLVKLEISHPELVAANERHDEDDDLG